MSQRVYFRDVNGDTTIPVADGSFFTPNLRVSQDECDVYFAFYSDADATTPATPTGGTITVNGEYEEGFFLQASSNPVITATEVSFPDATYTPSIVDGCSLRLRIDLAGVDAGLFMRAFAFRRA